MISSIKQVNILAISGSLRAASSNTTLLSAIGKMMPPQVQFQYSISPEHIPAFNPDNDLADGPAIPSVATFREQIALADGVLICTPEYAFGVPGALKNALDWTVSSGSLNEKPLIAVSASPLHTGGHNALASLLLTLKALGSLTSEQASLSIPSVNKIFSEEGNIKEEKVREQLIRLLDHFFETITAKAEQPE